MSWALAWLREREKATVATLKKSSAPDEMIGEAAQFQKFLNEHSERYMAGLRDDIALLKDEVGHLQRENTQCRNESNQLKQHIESLEEGLRRQGLEIPKRPLDRSLTVIEDGRTMTMRAVTDGAGLSVEPYTPSKS